jgi:putative transposase
MKISFAYCVAIIDWYSRYVLDWQISTSLESDFCVDVLSRVLQRNYGVCEIFNTDQGSQFTSHHFTDVLKSHAIKISMDGSGRALDNVFIERLWRSLKYECVFIHDFSSLAELNHGLSDYFAFYNNERHHQSLDYKKPRDVYFAGGHLSKKYIGTTTTVA